MTSSPMNTPKDSKRMPSPEEQLTQRFAQRFDELRDQLRKTEPALIAARCAADLAAETPESGRLKLKLWERPVFISYPDYVAYYATDMQPTSILDQALLLYYLTHADGTPLRQEWIGFSDLPDGRFYNQAFQGYTGQELARAFQNDLPAFERAAQLSGGKRQALGDAAFAFQALPRVPLLVIYWRGDEEFPSRCQVLFDGAASHYLPTDAYAILGSALTRRLIKAKNQLDAPISS